MVAFSGCTDKSTEDTSVKTADGSEGVGTKTATSTKVNELPSKYIQIDRSAGLYSSIGRYAKPDPGKVFLLLNMDIENHGYPEFSVSPLYFKVIIDGVEYSYDSSTYSLDERGLAPLDSVKLRDGGKTSGCLVYQIPDGKSRYVIEYSGFGSYNFEYGSLQTEEQKAPEPEPIIRDVSFYLGSDLFAISKDNLKGSIGYNSYSTTASTSQDGADANQVTKVDRDEGFLVIGIKTYLTEEGRPVDENKAIEDALIGAEKYVPVYANRINKGGTYETTLSSGEKVDVHVWKAPSNELYKGEANVCCFMPDDSTVVTVVASLSNSMTTRFFETLEIGDIPQS
jgi:hypothetical protein